MSLSSRSVLFTLFCGFLLLAFALQYAGGAYGSEFGESDDEAAHYLTGLMVHDYVLAGAPWPPMKYAVNYYERYPKVALGHWPPLYYVVQTIWMLLFSPSRVSVLVLQAGLISLFAATSVRFFAAFIGPASSFVIGSLLVLHPLMQLTTRQVSSEALTVVFILAGGYLYSRFLDQPAWKYAILFGLVSSFALLTKGTALLLAILPALAALTGNRLGLMRRLSFWVPWLIMTVLAAPWYLFAPASLHERVMDTPLRVPSNLGSYGHFFGTALKNLYAAAGPWLLVLAGVGLVSCGVLALSRARKPASIWAVSTSMIAALVLMIVFVPPTRDLRHIVPVLPFLLLLAAEGARQVAAAVPGSGWTGGRRQTVAAVLLAGAALGAWRPWQLPPKDFGGFSAVANAILAHPELKDSVLFISSDAAGEGMFISEVAMRERRPGHRILRASKTLSSSNWLGAGAKLKLATADEVRQFLSLAAVGAVVLDLSPAFVPVHHPILTQALLESGGEWICAGVYPERRGAKTFSEGIHVFVPRNPPVSKPAIVPSQLPPLPRRF